MKVKTLEEREEGIKGGKDSFFQTYFKPQENSTVLRTSVNTVGSSQLWPQLYLMWRLPFMAM